MCVIGASEKVTPLPLLTAAVLCCHSLSPLTIIARRNARCNALNLRTSVQTVPANVK